MWMHVKQGKEQNWANHDSTMAKEDSAKDIWREIMEWTMH